MPNYAEKPAFCPNCGEQVLARKKAMTGTGHAVHSTLTAATAGVWGLFYGEHARARANGTWRCNRCGQEVSPKVAPNEDLLDLELRPRSSWA